MKFIESITITFFDAKNRKLKHDLWIRTTVLNARLRLEDDKCIAFKIEKDFIMDLASIPRLMWWIISPTDWEMLASAIAHDWLYRNNGKIEVYIYKKETGTLGELAPTKFTRKESDMVLREKMESFGGGIIKRNMVYLAVRVFGRLAWK